MRDTIIMFTLMSLAFAPAPVPRVDRRPDLVQLQGEWEEVGFSSSGSPIRPLAKPGLLVFQGSRLTWYRGNMGFESTAEFTLDPNKKWIDMKDGMQSLSCIGIYRLQGNTLTLAIKSFSIDPVRPTDFE